MTEREQQERICPLCGGDNQCAMAAGQPDNNCWCQAVEISAAALDAIPAASVDKHCLCPACAAIKGDTIVER